MNLKKEEQKILKYHIEMNNEEYYVYQMPNDDEEFNSIGFYIQKKNSGIITFCIGIESKDLTFPIKEFIEDNINDWVLYANKDI